MQAQNDGKIRVKGVVLLLLQILGLSELRQEQPRIWMVCLS